MAEWLNAPDSKSGEGQPSTGSNPVPSAKPPLACSGGGFHFGGGQLEISLQRQALGKVAQPANLTKDIVSRFQEAHTAAISVDCDGPQGRIISTADASMKARGISQAVSSRSGARRLMLMTLCAGRPV